ncbi:MAG: prepilin-type N-terminal cleavage/methylation domain-containing protein [Burkholderiales bacterium]|nr:prepilin-type N-terminal cleavage/methylation domain-containing protein [Burkholderiales bacterium]
MKTKQAGFTLVEIAIVLVIIGLLLGGILKGQEMIVQAKVKNSITDFSGISAAYFGYQDRYRAIPGDDAGAGRWTTPTAATPGNGDRVLTGLYVPATPATDETGLWWDHLRRSGFVTGSGTGTPQNSFAGTIGVQQGDGTGVGATAPAAVLGGFTNLIMCSSNLPDKVAIALDVQMDDGNPIAGAVRATDDAGQAPPVSTAAAMSTSGYVETGTKIYTLCRQF